MAGLELNYSTKSNETNLNLNVVNANNNFIEADSKSCKIINFSCLVLCILFFSIFVFDLRQFWFSPNWTTDDAYQQLFPLHSIYHPEMITTPSGEEDIIYRMMRGYLTPLHYHLCYGLTILTADPIITGHIVMVIQILLTVVGIFSLGKYLASPAAGYIAVLWFLHTRHIIQRLTCGLPRGWAAPVIIFGLLFAVKSSHRLFLLTLFLSCLLHPPSAFIIGLAYGLLLLIKVVNDPAELPKLRGYLVLSPIYAIVTYISVKMPADFGSMANLKLAETMPEFANPGGRFPFVPLIDYWEELILFGFQAFKSKWYNTGAYYEYLILVIVATILIYGFLKRTNSLVKYNDDSLRILPLSITVFIITVLITHQLSRIFAFYLYVPNRHLQIPFNLILIVTIPAVIWRWGYPNKTKVLLGWLVIATLVYIGSGKGLDGSANFNTRLEQKGAFALWLKENTPKDALIAGHPTIVDPVPLVAQRRVYISTEMAHPFYQGYYNQIKDRIPLSLRAHYAKSLVELYDLVAPIGIDYFVFERAQFYPEKLDSASYFRPYNVLVKELTSGNYFLYAYRELPKSLDLTVAPFMPFKDHVSAIVDIKKLGLFLRKIR
jgi:hypothetical protein